MHPVSTSIPSIMASKKERLARCGMLCLALCITVTLSRPAQGAASSSPSVGRDTNGEPRAGLAIGAPGEDDDTGVVHALYANSDGIPNQVGERWWQGIDGIPGTRDMWDGFGTALASGDFNGDGYADLAVGVTGESVNGHGNAGMVQIIYAAHDGLTASGNVVFTQDDLHSTAEVNDAFGQVLAVGDFNADGYDDLAVGVPLEDVQVAADHAIDAGSVNVIYGSAVGLRADYNRLLDEHILGTSHEAGDQFGAALAACDFDGDGYDDLAIGVPGEDFGAISPVEDVGSVQIVFGSADRLVTSGNQVLFQGLNSLDNAAEAGDRFGSSLAAGVFDGDGYCDLAVGVASEEPGTAYTNSGAVHVLYGSDAAFAPPSRNWLWSRNDTDVAGEIQDYAYFGRVLAAGDFDGDGLDDLAIGTPYDDVGDEEDAGSVHVMYGGSEGISDWADRVWYQGGYVSCAAEENDRFGWALATGDVDGDGYDDLVIGTPYEHIGTVADAGMAQVFYGGSWGIPQEPRYDNLHQNKGSTAGSSEPEDRFGAAAAVLEAGPHKIYLPLIVRS